MTAGIGQRLRPLTYVRAKPAVPVAGVPLISRILRRLRDQGISDTVLNLSHKPETLAALIGEGREFGLRVRYSWEHPVLGSAGGPRRAMPLVGDDPFLIVNGDTLTTVDLRALWNEHHESGAVVTMSLIENPEPGKYNGVLVDDEGWVTGFARAGQAERSYHFVGPQVAAHEAFAGVKEGEYAESTWGCYQPLIASRPRSIRAFKVDGIEFLDIGTVADYVRTNEAIAAAEGTSPWTQGRNVRIAPSARVTRSIVWDDVTIGEGASIEGCVVTDGVTILPGAAFSNSAIVAASEAVRLTLRDGARLEGGLLISPVEPKRS
jgi:NDP-sugar pyrophosphorylase family protein